MKQLHTKVSKNYLFLALVLFVVAVRLPQLFDMAIPFQFDHGKDAVATLHMWQTLSPKFVGPWTSIPGLFFGPAWYYLLLFPMIVSNGAPIASVVAMILLGLFTLYCCYKLFGFLEAFLLATSNVFYTVTTSAWNPFPMVLLTVLILGFLKRVEKQKIASPKDMAILGLAAAFGFHFSTAFAIFFPVVIIFSLIFNRTKTSIQAVLVGILAFFIPFIPQLLFELKNNFIQSKGVIAYLQKGDSDPASMEKLAQVLSTTFNEFKLLVTSTPMLRVNQLNLVVELLLASTAIASLFFFVKRKPNYKKYILYLFWFAVPVLGFTFLHFNIWYILPLQVVFLMFYAQVLRAAPRSFLYLAVLLFTVCNLSRLDFYFRQDRAQLLAYNEFLPAKMRAIEYVYATAGDRPFSSYHYEPDIYDYPYQYLYFWYALKGNRLPVEFSYKPNETAYIPDKSELMMSFQDKVDTRQPEVVFFIVENEPTSWQETWWGQQQFETILAEEKISEHMSVFVAEPKR